MLLLHWWVQGNLTSNIYSELEQDHMPLEVSEKRIILAFHKCVNLGAQEQWTRLI